MQNKIRQAEGILRSYVRMIVDLKQARDDLTALTEHGALTVQTYGHVGHNEEISNPVQQRLEQRERLRQKIARLSETVRKVERLRTKLFERGRYSPRHEAMRLMLECVFFAGIDWKIYVKGLKNERYACELKQELLTLAAKVLCT